MVGEAFELFAWTVGGRRLEVLGDRPVELAAALLQQAAVGDLVGQRVLEGVLGFGKQPRLVDELGRLQLTEAAPQFLLRRLGDGQK